MPFQVVHNNIVRMKTDAIVNAANSRLLAGGGVCGAIFSAAGAEQLQKACDEKGCCPVGEAVITDGFRLSAKYVIHAVGPIWRGGNQGEAQYLKSAYLSSLALAVEYGCESISFPLISSGIYGYPKREALDIAVSAFREFLQNHEMNIYLVVFDRQAVTISEKIYSDVKHYIDTYAVDTRRRCGVNPKEYQQLLNDAPLSYMVNEPPAPYFVDEESVPLPYAAGQPMQEGLSAAGKTAQGGRSLDDLLSHLQETFPQMLFRLIDEKGYSDVEVYKRANIDRKLFSKIKCTPDYCPKKRTVISLAIALRLTLDETIDLLNRAGYSLSLGNKADVIIRFFLENKEYDIFLINETLFAFEQPLL